MDNVDNRKQTRRPPLCVHIRPAMCPYPQQQHPTSEEEQHAAGHCVFCLAGRKGGERAASSVYSGERVEAEAGRPPNMDNVDNFAARKPQSPKSRGAL